MPGEYGAWLTIRNLRYHWLSDFDREMMRGFGAAIYWKFRKFTWRFDNKMDKILSFQRGDFLMVFNFNPTQSFTDYGIPLEPSKYKILFNTDEGRFGGQERIDKKMIYYTRPAGGNEQPALFELIFAGKDRNRFKEGTI